jgi:copper homeostasis protein
MIFEVCVETVESAIAAKQGGANRLELCSSLLEGGLTPSVGLCELVLEQIGLETNVMIRPRGGDFCFSDLEFEVMCRDINRVKAIGVHGVVIGMLTPDGYIDFTHVKKLVELARPLSVTFHRAFDLVVDPKQTLEDLISMGVDRILTSGQAPTAEDGLDLITSLVSQADGRIKIMPGGGVNENNIQKIVRISGVEEVHSSASVAVDRTAYFTRHNCVMGRSDSKSEMVRRETDLGRVRKMVELLEGVYK